MLANELSQTVGSIDLQRHAGRARLQQRRDAVSLVVRDDGRIWLIKQCIEVRNPQRSGSRKNFVGHERGEFAEKRRVARPLFVALQHRAACIHRHNIHHPRR
jgi:hypothetical protein